MCRVTRAFLAVAPFVIVLSGCATMHGESEDCEPSKAGPKTIFKWNTGEDTKPEDPAEEPEEDEIATDRPDFTEASSTVGKGRIQLESGYTFSRNADQGSQNNHSYPEALFRIGMFAEWFEWRIAQNWSNTREAGADGGVFSTSGGDDLYVGSKLALTLQDGYLPESALIIQATVPTGPRDLTAGRVLPGLNWLYGWDVVPDLLTFAGSTQGNANVDDIGHSYFEMAQSLTVGYSLTKKLGAYTEVFGIFPDGAQDSVTGPEYYFDGGFTYKFTPNFQYDIRGGVGLNRHAQDYFVGSGFAVRY